MSIDNTAQTTFTSSNTKNLPVERITAMWALSEAALGGILHAFKIPLTGLFVNGSAVIFIALIAYYAQKSGAILRATLIVLLVKGGVSPHTPINAYLFNCEGKPIPGPSLRGELKHFIQAGMADSTVFIVS